MKNIISKLRQTVLPVALCVAIIAGTVGVGVFYLTEFCAKSELPESSSINSSSLSENKLVIGVPECIYLTPSTSAMTDFKYAVNNIVDSSGNLTKELNGSQETMKVYFYLSGATLSSITLSSHTA